MHAYPLHANNVSTSFPRSSLPYWIANSTQWYPIISFNLRNRRAKPTSRKAPSPSSASSVNHSEDNCSAGRAVQQRQQLSDILRLAAPALVVVLTDPLQTLVDSACIGRCNSIFELASLGPNTAIYNAVFHLSSFLGIATAQIIAQNSLKDPETIKSFSETELLRRKKNAESTLCNSLLLALILGIIELIFLRRCGTAILAAMGAAPEILPYALQYLAIRAISMPAVLLMNVNQGVYIGEQNTLVPMTFCLVATAMHILGDLYSVGCLKMGVVGAAISATASQVCASFLLFMTLLNRNNRRINNNSIINTTTTKGIGSGGDAFCVQLHWKGLPQLHTMANFFNISIALIARTVVGMVAYFAMTATATSLGTVLCAAHQLAMQTFWFFSFFPEPLSIAAQTLIAKERDRPHRAKEWAVALAKTGFGAGLVLACVIYFVFTYGTSVFTSNAAVQISVQSIAPYGTLAMVLCGGMMAFDGISIGSGAMTHLSVSVGLGMVGTLCMLQVSRRLEWGLAGVWMALLAFYGIRVLGHLVYYFALPRRKTVFS